MYLFIPPADVGAKFPQHLLFCITDTEVSVAFPFWLEPKL